MVMDRVQLKQLVEEGLFLARLCVPAAPPDRVAQSLRGWGCDLCPCHLLRPQEPKGHGLDLAKHLLECGLQLASRQMVVVQ